MRGAGSEKRGWVAAVLLAGMALGACAQQERTSRPAADWWKDFASAKRGEANTLLISGQGKVVSVDAGTRTLVLKTTGGKRTAWWRPEMQVADAAVAPLPNATKVDPPMSGWWGAQTPTGPGSERTYVRPMADLHPGDEIVFKGMRTSNDEILLTQVALKKAR